MATSLNTGQLHPYKSLLLAELGAGTLQQLTTTVVDAVVDVVEQGVGRTVDGRHAWTEAGTQLAAIFYREERQSPWTEQPGFVDITNHLVLCARRKRLMAFFCSDTGVRNQIARGIEKGSGGLANLALIRPGRLNSAFVSNRTARTMWLSGTHRRTSVKADSKVLTGIDLRDALDPLDDQSYHFSSIRCESPLASVPLGVSPRNSRVWAGRAEDWPDFRSTVEAVLGHLDASRAEDLAPLPVLATPASGTPDGAFDVALLPDEGFGSDPGVDAVRQAEAEMLVDRALLEVIAAGGSDFTTSVRFADYDVGSLDFKVDATDPENVSIEVEGVESGPETKELFGLVKQNARRKNWLKVRYESGHTVSDGMLYSTRHRDVAFGYVWGRFDGFARKQEKPADLKDIGKTKSLFCWVQRFWPSIIADQPADRSWLACDDGSMEIADFVHLDTSSAVPRLSLIHVKGAKNDDVNRGVSVSPYEVVTGQAVKNIRHLDHLLLAEGLGAGLGKKISKLVWNNGAPAAREDMITELDGLGANYARDVVIVQPQLSKDAWERGGANPDGQDAARLRQLDTLLVGAAGSCRNVGASLIVVGDAGPLVAGAPPALTQ